MVLSRNKQGKRVGYTTGSNAAAAAKAATTALLTGVWPERVPITLPTGEIAVMTPVECTLGADSAFCGMIKDAGDDPDVTHGALICAMVRYSAIPGLHIEGGVGVGRVTLPGLGLAVGSPAINPVPRQQITDNVRDAVREILGTDSQYWVRCGLDVIISVPEGARLALKTLNARLGIVGGISILGTTGKVFPYSTASWRASVIQAIEVAVENAVPTIVLSTGGRSEKFAMRFFPELPPVAFVELSVFTGDALKTCVTQGGSQVVFVGMIGKMIKTAQGYMQTHVAGNQVDFAFLTQVCRETGAPDDLVAAVAVANTGRHFLELCQAHAFLTPLQRIVDLALESCLRFIYEQGGRLSLDVILIDFDGTILARAAHYYLDKSALPVEVRPSLIERLAEGAVLAEDDQQIDTDDG